VVWREGSSAPFAVDQQRLQAAVNNVLLHLTQSRPRAIRAEVTAVVTTRKSDERDTPWQYYEKHRR